MIVSFDFSAEEQKVLGEPAYIETDGRRTTGARWFFWGFEDEASGNRIVIVWDEGGFVLVTADPPDPDAAVEMLRRLGVNARFEQRALAKDRVLSRSEARGCVWLFTPDGTTAVTAVFSRKQNADAWLRRTQFSGTLRAYPIDRSLYETARSFGATLLPPEDSPDGAHFVDLNTEVVRYERGLQKTE